MRRFSRTVRDALEQCFAFVVAGVLVFGLLALSPGRLGSSGVAGGSFGERVWISWQDGRPVWAILGPAVVVTVLRVIPALVVVMAAAGALATRRGRVGDQVRRLVRGVSSLPLFLGCYLGIIVVNRLTHAYIEGGGSAPGYFALPLGDGRPHIVRWALEVLVLAMGDGALALAVSRVRERVEELETQPFVLAAEVNGGGGLAAIRRHLVSTLRLTTAELIPLLLGGTLVMETIFLERGVGRVLVKCLEARDLPVVGAIVFIGLTLSFVLRGILREAP